MKKIKPILIAVILLTTSIAIVNATPIYSNSEDTVRQITEEDTLQKYETVLGPFIYLWLEADLSPEEFCYFYYDPDLNKILLSVEFLSEDANTDSYIKWGTLLNNPDINPSFFYHNNLNFNYYYVIQIDKVFEKNIKFSNGRIQINTKGIKGIILITGVFEPYHNLSIPRKPAIIGPIKAKTGLNHNYTFFSRSYDDSLLYYYIEWGDGTNTGWLGPYESCKDFTLNHTWISKGKYEIKAKCRNFYGNESSITKFNVKISNIIFPRDHIFIIPLFIGILDKFLNKFLIYY